MATDPAREAKEGCGLIRINFRFVAATDNATVLGKLDNVRVASTAYERRDLENLSSEYIYGA